MSRRPGTMRERAGDYIRADPKTMDGHHITLFLLTGAALSIGALIGVAWVAGFQACWVSLRHGDWPWLAAAPVALIVSHLGYTVAYRQVAQVADGPTLGTSDATALVLAGFGPFHLRGGYAIDSHGLVEQDTGDEHGVLRVLVLGVLEYAILAPIAWAAALWMLLDGRSAQAGLVPSWLIGVPVGALMTLTAWVLYHRFRRRSRVVRSGCRGFRAIRLTLEMLVRPPGGTAAWAGMALYWAGEIALLGVCLAAFEPHRAGVAALTLAYATGYALTRRTLPLAGAGPVEVLLPIALAWVSYPLATAVIAVAAYRVFNLWLTIVPSALALRRLRRGPAPSAARERIAEGQRHPERDRELAW